MVIAQNRGYVQDVLVENSSYIFDTSAIPSGRIPVLQEQKPVIFNGDNGNLRKCGTRFSINSLKANPNPLSLPCYTTTHVCT